MVYRVTATILAISLVYHHTCMSLRAEELQFNRDIRPILSAKCYSCHGPDAAARQADLRLDQPSNLEDSVIRASRNQPSELFRRINSVDPEQRMPPSGEPLSKDEIAKIQLWIEQGARYEIHWSFIPPTRPPLPAVQWKGWPHNEIDYFVLKGLESRGRVPASPASSAELLRRMTFDTTGLPPSIDELDHFIADLNGNRSPEHASRAAAERLLASQHYGEHRARFWLDAARFADTNGFFTDDERQMWLWRNWVVEAYNKNLPFDQFTIEQLAGDLLPNSTLSQKIATGFNRNHMVTHETGVIDEEYRVEYVVDRLNTTSTVWMGLTIGCARCHDHKFDPISQREFYQLFAFFNNSPEKGNAGHGGNTEPFLEVASPDTTDKISELSRRKVEADLALAGAAAEIFTAEQKWQATTPLRDAQISDAGLRLHLELDDLAFGKPSASKPQIVADSKNVAWKKVGSVKSTPGVVGGAALFDGKSHLAANFPFELDRGDSFSFAAWIHPTRSGPICVVSKSDDGDGFRGFDVMVRKSKIIVQLAHRWNSNAIQVVSVDSIKTGKWQHLVVTYDGSSRAAGIQLYLDGESQAVDVRADRLTDSIATQQPLRIGQRSTSAPFDGRMDDVRFYDRVLPAAEVLLIAHVQWISGILATNPEERTSLQKLGLKSHFLKWHASKRLTQLDAVATGADAELRQAKSGQPTAMVMQDRETVRPTHILERGQYDAPGELVDAGFPALFSAELSVQKPAAAQDSNRLALANWLVADKHPLTSRVTVNRLWQEYFGAGLVRTTDDFGAQGDWPSHPDLLDWLAVELVESGWDLKHIQRLIVNSATYQQAAGRQLDSKSLSWEDDRENLWLGRGPRNRLDAETIRDNSLSVSGLLVHRIGGPSTAPYQPPGLWEAVSYDGNLTYPLSTGADRFRRGLYTFWKRQSPPPNLMAFDAPTRETCTVSRPNTNTPLQALVLMNDPSYVEPAVYLAKQVTCQPSLGDPERISRIFRLATSRQPDEREQQILGRFYRSQLQHYQMHPQLALQWSRTTTSTEEPLSPAEFAAFSALANMVLSLDETIHK